jgi:type II secretory pathway pseudopilin PulG
MMHRKLTLGLTLIELVVLTTLFGMLGSVGLLGYVEALTRTRIAVVQNDLRVLSVAAETYYVDHSTYPPNLSDFTPLTHPVAYLPGSLPRDAFDPIYNYLMIHLTRDDSIALHLVTTAFPGDVTTQDFFFDHSYLFLSVGPDGVFDLDLLDDNPRNALTFDDFIDWFHEIADSGGGRVYDPTNGTISAGDIGRTRKGIARSRLFN